MQENQFSQNEETQNEIGNNPDFSRGIQAGPIIGSVIVIVVLVFGGLYFLGKKVTKEGLLGPTPQEIIDAPDSRIRALETLGTSDEIDALEEDLGATKIEELDTELSNIETELGL